MSIVWPTVCYVVQIYSTLLIKCFNELMYWPDIPVKSAAVGLKASLMPMAGSTDLRLNLFCILNLWPPNRKLFPNHLPPCWKQKGKRCSKSDCNMVHDLNLGRKISILVLRRPVSQEASWRAVSWDSREDSGVFLSLGRTTCRLSERPRYGSSNTV